MSWTFIAYLVCLHLLAIPGAYMLLVFGLMLFLSSTTNILTGQPKPWARGLGWAFIGVAAGGLVSAAVCWGCR